MIQASQFGEVADRTTRARRNRQGLFNGRASSDQGRGTGRADSDYGQGTGRNLDADATSSWADTDYLGDHLG